MPTRKPTTARRAAAPAATSRPARKIVAAKAAAAAPAKSKPAKSAAPAPEAASAAPTKSKPKLVRDSFTMPKAEYQVIDALKQRAASLAQPVKKSELLRAGIKALSAMSDAALLATLRSVPTIKTGRPNKA